MPRTRWLPLLFLLCAIALVGCDARPPISAPIASQDLTKGYRLERVKADPDNPGDVLVVLSLSGGGMRAAALAYGTLEALRDVSVPIGGMRRSLLDEVDVINAVSGGALSRRITRSTGDGLFRDFKERFLDRDVERDLRSGLPPTRRGSPAAFRPCGPPRRVLSTRDCSKADVRRSHRRRVSTVRRDQCVRPVDWCALSIYAGAIRPALLRPRKGSLGPCGSGVGGLPPYFAAITLRNYAGSCGRLRPPGPPHCAEIGRHI